MKSLLFYLLQVVIVSGILYAYYHVALRNKKFHQYNRFYILMAAVASILIPFLNIPVYFTGQDTSSAWLYTLQNLSGRQPVIIFVEDGEAGKTFNWQSVWYVLYTLIGLFGLARVLLSIRKLKKLMREHPAEHLNGIRFINTAEPGTPFSFFRWLFWNNKIELDSQKGEQIFRHEVFHIQQKHSLDIIFMEIVTIVFWINPVFHLMKKELKAIHEFLADRFATNETQKWEYAELLLMQALNTQHQLVHPFFHNQIKRRIAMITNPHKTSHQYLRKLLVLPLAALLITLFAFSYREKQSDSLNENSLPEQSSLFLPDTIPMNTLEIKEVKIQEVRADITATGRTLNNNGKNALFPGLVIFNGKEYTREEFAKMTGDYHVFESRSFISTSANDPKAIAKYGEKARNGVVEFVGATIDTIGPKQKPVRISLRGVTSSNGKEPLIVLDGKELERKSTRSALTDIDPNTIESVTVLKDSAATRRYGAKAENGVLEITTRETLTLSPITSEQGELNNIRSVKGVPLSQPEEVTVVGYAKKKTDKTDADLKEVTVVGYGKKKTDKTEAQLEEVTVTGYAKKRTDADLKEVTVVGYPARRNNDGKISYRAVGVQQSPSSSKTENLQLQEVNVSPVNSSAVVYPNPASNSVSLKLNANEDGDVIIRIIDMSGKERSRTKTTLTKGANTTSVSTGDLAPGTYIIRIDGQKQNLHSSFKLLKE